LPTTSGTLVVTGGAQTIEFADGTVSAPSITNSGDTNTGIYFPAADIIGFTEGGVESMRINSDGNVLIGGTQSLAKLTVNNGIFAVDESGVGTKQVYIRSNYGAIGPAIQVSTNDPLLFVTNNTERMRIDTSGMLGLGITPAQTSGIAIELGGSANNNAINFLNSSNVQGWITSNAYYNGTNWLRKYAGGATCTAYTTNDQGCHVWRYAAASTVGSTIAWSEAMRIDAVGNVGIGTSSPTTSLEIIRNQAAVTAINVLNSNSSGSARLRVGFDTSNCYDIFRVGNSADIIQNATQSTANIIWQTGGTEDMRITAAGQLLISTTGTTPGYFNSSTGTQISGGVIYTSSAGGSAFGNPTSGGGVLISFGTINNWNTGTISTNNSNTSYNTSSDYRLKENIAPMTGALDIVSALKPCTYTWKVDGSSGEGFIAHELQEVCPLAVTGKKDAVDKDGKPVYQGIDTSFLVATLTAAIQEQQAIITQLQADVAALKGAK
jgi:hypothetical protein